jgi:hypothetical protein
MGAGMRSGGRAEKKMDGGDALGIDVGCSFSQWAWFVRDGTLACRTSFRFPTLRASSHYKGVGPRLVEALPVSGGRSCDL